MIDQSKRNLLAATTLLLGTKVLSVTVARASLMDIAIPSFHETIDLLSSPQNLDTLLRRIHGVWTIAYCIVLRKFPNDAHIAYEAYGNFLNTPPIQQVANLRDSPNRVELLQELRNLHENDISTLLNTSRRVEPIVLRLASEIHEQYGASNAQYFEELIVSLVHAERIEIVRPAPDSDNSSWWCRSFLFQWACGN